MRDTSDAAAVARDAIRRLPPVERMRRMLEHVDALGLRAQWLAVSAERP